MLTKITKIDHIGIAVQALEQRLAFWAEALGMDVCGVETVDSEQVKVAFLSAGNSRIELLEPTSQDSTIARHIAKRGEGIHHLTLEVSDLPRLLAQLRSTSVEVIGEAPRRGAGGRLVAFLHPKSSGGVLIELVQRPKSEAAFEDEPIAPGAPVLLYLREPQEKMWGVLRRLDTAGVVAEGVDLASFDDWLSQIERDEESVVGPSVLFIPMSRLEKILLDRASGHLPSLAQRFERRIGRTVQQVLAEL